MFYYRVVFETDRRGCRRRPNYLDFVGLLNTTAGLRYQVPLKRQVYTLSNPTQVQLSSCHHCTTLLSCWVYTQASKCKTLQEMFIQCRRIKVVQLHMASKVHPNTVFVQFWPQFSLLPGKKLHSESN